MIDWKKIVREHLADSGLSAEKENEVVEELSHLLEDASRDERLDAGSPGAVEAFLRREVPEWETLKKKLRPRRENTAAAAVAPVPVVGARPERGSFLSGLGMDLRVAWRLVVRNPGFTAVVVLTLALGVGLNSSIFSLVNYLLLRPLPVESPEELVQVYSREPAVSSQRSRCRTRITGTCVRRCARFRTRWPGPARSWRSKAMSSRRS